MHELLSSKHFAPLDTLYPLVEDSLLSSDTTTQSCQYLPERCYLFLVSTPYGPQSQAIVL